MIAPDFATIIAKVVLQLGVDGRHSALVLAAKVPELCQTCHGSGCTRNRPPLHGIRCQCAEPLPCSDCPTIGRLLAIGVAVFGRKIGAESPTFDGYSLGMIEDWTDGANWMLAALREVQT